MKRYSRFRRRIPLHPAVSAAAARSLVDPPIIRAGENRQTEAHCGCPSGVRFTLTRNDGLIERMG
jgi:hypothetical protein